jgi:putative transcriptional regulator
MKKLRYSQRRPRVLTPYEQMLENMKNGVLINEFTELAEKIGITQANLSILKTGKGRAIRFSTLEAICKVLKCQPGDILEFGE